VGEPSYTSRETGDQEHQAEDQADVHAATGAGERDGMEIGRSGEAIDQRDTVEQHAGAEGAEDEVLQAGLRRAQAVTLERGEDVEREALQLQAHVERDEAGSGDHQQHAEGGEQHEDGEFEAAVALQLEEFVRHQDAESGAGEDQELGEAGKAIDGESAVEGGARLDVDENDPCGAGQDDDGEPRHDARGGVADGDAADQQDHRADRDDQLRQEGEEVGLQGHFTVSASLDTPPTVSDALCSVIRLATEAEVTSNTGFG
jgi:hypothetical protein